MTTGISSSEDLGRVGLLGSATDPEEEPERSAATAGLVERCRAPLGERMLG